MVARQVGTGITEASSGAVSFYVKDHLGSTRIVLASGTGFVEASYDYSPFGEVMRSTITVESRYTYTGQESDGESGLMNYHARLYDPAVGRFGATDPAGQFNSPYAYVGYNPVSFTDPSGEVPLLVAFMIAGAIQGAVFGAFQAYLDNAMNGGGSLPLGKVLLGAGRGALGGAATGAVSFGFATTGAFRIASVENTWSAGARNLAAGALASSSSSIAGNIGSLRSPLRRINIGVGNFSVTLRDGSISTNPFDHLGNIATLGTYSLGVVSAATSSGASISFDKRSMSPVFSGGWLAHALSGDGGGAVWQGAIFIDSRRSLGQWKNFISDGHVSPEEMERIGKVGSLSHLVSYRRYGGDYETAWRQTTEHHESVHILQDILGGGWLRNRITTSIFGIGKPQLQYDKPPFNPFEYGATVSVIRNRFFFR